MPKVTFIIDGEPQTVEFEHGTAAVLAPRQARVVPRRRQEPRRAARARLRRQLRLHDLPRHHPRRRRRT